jgi:hypothetical protein
MDYTTSQTQMGEMRELCAYTLRDTLDFGISGHAFRAET